MKAIVTLEHRFRRTPDGTVWSQTMFGYPFWQRYLEIYAQVKVVARVMDVDELDSGWKPASGEGVQFHAVPYYHGFGAYLNNRGKINKAIQSAYEPEAAVICRVPSQVGSCLVPYLRKRHHPYAVEVVGDPWDVLAPGAVRHPLRSFFRCIFTHRLRQQCRHACAAAYVTEHALQKRYPPAPGAFTTHYSSIELPPEAFAKQHREPRPSTARRRIICVGTLDQMYKAPDVLIDAVAQCVTQGLDLELVWIGDGKHRGEMEQRARERGLALGDRMHFRGKLPAGQAVRDELDQADFFVLPSRQEGLPRVVIEAMARGLPCVASTVGGIGELLQADEMVPANDTAALTTTMTRMLESPQRMSDAARRNLAKAGDYRDDLLRARRLQLYEQLRQQTAAASGQREGS